MTGDADSAPTPDLRGVLRASLKDAMRARDRLATSALRSAIAAVDNAEAVPRVEPVQTVGAGTGTDGSPIAGAAVGVGATEATRRTLSADLERALVRGEVAERRDAAAEVEAAGHRDRAADLRHEADVLESVLATSARIRPHR